MDRVALYEVGHEHLAEYIPSALYGRIRTVMFNLGYLPGARDKQVVTQAHTMLLALEAALAVLAPGRIVTVVVYVGHPGGMEEAEAVEAWALAPQRYQVLAYRFVNQGNAPPWLLAIEKKHG